MKLPPNRKIILFAVILGGLLVLPFMCHALEAVLTGNVGFSFYGKLVDQNNNPIPDISINYTVEQLIAFNGGFFFQNPGSSVTTDSQGCFEIQGHGTGLDIDEPIEVPGYEYSYTTNPKTSFGYAPPSTPDNFTATEANPLVFTLRKKDMPAYLLGRGPMHQSRLELMEDVTDDINESVYLVPLWIEPDGRLGDLPGDEEPQQGQVLRKGGKDLLVEGSLSADGTQYNLEFSPLVLDSGIILSDQLLYEAPESDYQPSVQLSVPRGTRGLKKYLYIKLEGGNFYGRLETEIEIGSAEDNDSENQILIDTWINPDGSRNLEFDHDYQWDERQWRELLDNLGGGYGHFGDYVKKYKEYAAELVEDYGLSSLPEYENEDQFLAALQQLRAEKDAQNPKWWHTLEKNVKNRTDE